MIRRPPAFALAAALLLGPVPAPGEPEHLYVGAGKCRTCHEKELIGDQYGAWLEGTHARAFRTLLGEQAGAIARERGLGAAHEADACLSCHATAHGVPPARVEKRLETSDGVQCESCHGPGRDYRKKRIMSDPDQARARGLWDAEGDATICTACHNPESPTFDPERYRLPDGGTTGFDFEQAKKRIAHPIPEDVKGRFVEIERERKAAAKSAAGR